MKKYALIMILSCILICCGCRETALPLNHSSNTIESFDVYQITGTSSFDEQIAENPIDRDYNREFYEQATTTKEFLAVQDKYLKIWKDELAQTQQYFSKPLTAEEKEEFLKAQQEWENSIKATQGFEREFLRNPDHHIYLGSAYPYLAVSEHREAYRQRTIRIKYLCYLAEAATSTAQNDIQVHFYYS